MDHQHCTKWNFEQNRYRSTKTTEIYLYFPINFFIFIFVFLYLVGKTRLKSYVRIQVKSAARRPRNAHRKRLDGKLLCTAPVRFSAVIWYWPMNIMYKCSDKDNTKRNRSRVLRLNSSLLFILFTDQNI